MLKVLINVEIRRWGWRLVDHLTYILLSLSDLLILLIFTVLTFSLFFLIAIVIIVCIFLVWFCHFLFLKFLHHINLHLISRSSLVILRWTRKLELFTFRVVEAATRLLLHGLLLYANLLLLFFDSATGDTNLITVWFRLLFIIRAHLIQPIDFFFDIASSTGLFVQFILSILHGSLLDNSSPSQGCFFFICTFENSLSTFQLLLCQLPRSASRPQRLLISTITQTFDAFSLVFLESSDSLLSFLNWWLKDTS